MGAGGALSPNNDITGWGLILQYNVGVFLRMLKVCHESWGSFVIAMLLCHGSFDPRHENFDCENTSNYWFAYLLIIKTNVMKTIS